MSSVEDTTKGLTAGTPFQKGTESEVPETEEQTEPTYAIEALEYICLADGCRFKAVCYCDGKAFCQVHGEDYYVDEPVPSEKKPKQQPLDPKSVAGKRRALEVQLEGERKCATTAWNAVEWARDSPEESQFTKKGTISALTGLAEGHEARIDEIVQEIKDFDKSNEQQPLDPNSLEGKRHALKLEIESERDFASKAWNGLAWVENRTKESNDSVHSQADTIRTLTQLARRSDSKVEELLKELDNLETPTTKILPINTVADVAAILGTEDTESVQNTIEKLLFCPSPKSQVYEKYGLRIVLENFTHCDKKTWALSVIDEDERIIARGEVNFPEVSSTPICDKSGISTLTQIGEDLETLYKSNPEDKERIEYIIGEAKPILVEACKILSASSPDIHKKRLEGKVREWFAQEDLSNAAQHKLEVILRICKESKSDSTYIDFLKKSIEECDAIQKHARMKADGLSRVLHL